MGSKEFLLFMKFVFPVIVKLFNKKKEGVDVINEMAVFTNELANNPPDVIDALIAADTKQTDDIINGVVDLITGVGDGAANIVKALGNIFKKKS